MNRIKRLAITAAAIVLTCFNSCDGNGGEILEESANTAQITETTLEISETVLETGITETETVETTETETEEETFPRLTRPSLKGFDRRAAEYVTTLVDAPDFTGLCQNCVGAMVADMNGDGTPEVFLEIPETMCSVTEVFTVRDGKTVCLKAAPDSYTPYGDGVSHGSYDGGLPEIYVGDCKKIILAKCHSGGSVSGSSGIMEIILDGENISAKQLCGDYYSKSNFDVFYSYRFGGEDVSEEEYLRRLDCYMDGLDYCTDYSVTLTREILESGCGRPLDLLAKAVDSFYRNCNMADGLEFAVELKPVYVSRRNGSTGLDTYKAVLSYDAMGNVSSIFRKHYSDSESSVDICPFKYDYDDNGRVMKIHGFNNYTPEVDYDWSIDYYGNINIIRTRSNYPYTDMDESFYKVVTDEQGRVLEETFLANERAAEIYSYEGVNVGDVLSRNFYCYDNFGNKIYEELDTIIYEAKDSIQDYVETWEYDDCNRLVKHTFNYGCNSIDEYFYNDDGDMVELIHTFIGDDELNGRREGVYVTDYYYEKDLKGGVTRRCGKGSDYYDDDIIEDIYYAPVRVVK